LPPFEVGAEGAETLVPFAADERQPVARLAPLPLRRDEPGVGKGRLVFGDRLPVTAARP
jgi:hypothetical protein